MENPYFTSKFTGLDNISLCLIMYLKLNYKFKYDQND